MRARRSPAGSARPARMWSAWIALTLLGACAVLVRPAGAVTVRGQVFKGDARVPTQGIPVELHVVQGDQELPGRSAVSGPNGAFRFTGLSDDAGLQYYLSIEYKGALYTEGPLPTAGRSETVRDLVVYDVGSDIAAVQVTNHHIIVAREADLLHVTEVVIFQNLGATAYLGVGLNHAENVGIRMGLPAAVKNFQAGMGGDDATVRLQGRDLSSSRPIPPGTHPFSFTYDVPLSGRVDLSHRLYFPTQTFMVLLGDPAMKLETSSLHATGVRDQGTQKFAVYEGSNFPVGADVQMKIGGAGIWTNPKVYPWLAAPFLIAAALIVARRMGKRAASATGGRAAEATAHGGPAPAPHVVRAPEATPAPVAQAPPAPKPIHRPAKGGGEDDLSGVYLYLIAALDQGAERGEFSKESHALVRGNLKRRLETILSDQPRTGTR